MGQPFHEWDTGRDSRKGMEQVGRLRGARMSASGADIERTGAVSTVDAVLIEFPVEDAAADLQLPRRLYFIPAAMFEHSEEVFPFHVFESLAKRFDRG
jgi:hypothetical protein